MVKGTQNTRLADDREPLLYRLQGRVSRRQRPEPPPEAGVDRVDQGGAGGDKDGPRFRVVLSLQKRAAVAKGGVGVGWRWGFAGTYISKNQSYILSYPIVS